MNESRLSYIENAGRGNLKERHDNADTIRREANTLLTLFLTGAGVALAYAAPTNPIALNVIVPSLAASLYLFMLAYIVSWKTLAFGDYPAISNEPRAFDKAGDDLTQIRCWELELLQQRIDDAVRINDERSRWLNRCRFSAALTPAIAFGAWLAYHCW